MPRDQSALSTASCQGRFSPIYGIFSPNQDNSPPNTYVSPLKQELQPHFTVLSGCYISITCPVPCRISYRTRRKQNTIETVVLCSESFKKASRVLCRCACLRNDLTFNLTVTCYNLFRQQLLVLALTRLLFRHYVVL